MSLYPILIDWQDVPCLIAGGGAVARRKAEMLCAQGAAVTVVSPVVCPELQALPVTILRRAVTEADVRGRFLVVDATGDAAAEDMLSLACRKAQILFNSACRADDGTAVFPAVHQKGRTTVAVSSAGSSPAASVWLRDMLARHVPERMDDILDCMARLRPLSRDFFADQSVRRLFLHRCLDAMLKEDKLLTPERIEEIRLEIVQEQTMEENES